MSSKSIKPIELVQSGPGILQLEEDNKAPMPSPGQMVAMALDAKGKQEAELHNLRILNGHFASVICALITMLEENPNTAYLVKDGMVVISQELINRITGMQVEGIETGDGDVGIIKRERAPQLLVRGGRSG